MKNVLTFWDGKKLRRSDIFVVPKANKSLSPIGAASSGLFSDDAALGRRLDSLEGGGNFVLHCALVLANWRKLVQFVSRVSSPLLKPFKRF